MPNTSTRMGLITPLGTEGVNIDAHLKQLADGVDSNAAMFGQGTFSTLPVSTAGTPGIRGRFFMSTDGPAGGQPGTYVLFYDYGTGWAQVTNTFVLGSGSVSNSNLADNSVSTAKIQDAAVTGPKIANGAVSSVKLAADVPVVPIGSTLGWPWAAGSIPAWSLLPYGQLLSGSAYLTLQAIADASARPYGGVAGTNFNAPDERGRVEAGKDDMGGTAANRITAAISGVAGTVLGAVIGTEGVTLTTAQLPAHNHPVTGAPSAGNLAVASHAHGGGNHTHSSNAVGETGGIGSGGGIEGTVRFAATINYSGNIIAAEAPAVTGAPGIGSLATSNSGSGAVHLNTQPTIIVNKIMRVL